MSTATEHGRRTEDMEPTFLERVAERLGATAKASAIYGEPFEKDGVTIITVAKARYGFGGGGGGGPEGEGSGGGGGATVSPTGYIEIRDGAASYHPIYDPMSVVALCVGAAFGTLLVLRSLRKLLR